jgi:hypothetical protein
MVTVFWVAEDILFIDYLEKGKTITREYYSNFLTSRHGLQKKKIIFHQDIAPTHKSGLAMGKLRDLHYNCWNIHPIPEIWLPLTSISSQHSNSSSLVSVFL